MLVIKAFPPTHHYHYICTEQVQQHNTEQVQWCVYNHLFINKIMPRTSKPRSKTDAIVRRRLASNLYALRKKTKLTQEEAAHKAGMSVAHYQMVEYGRINLTLATVSKLAEGLSIDVAMLFKKQRK